MPLHLLRSVVAVACGLGAFLGASAARADAPAKSSNRSPFEVDPVIEIPVTLGLGAALGMSRVFSREVLRPACNPCNPADVNAFDRTVIGWHSSDLRTVSDVNYALSLTVPFAFSFFDTLLREDCDGWGGMAKDFLVLAETAMAALSTNNFISFAVRRPRPLAYDPTHFSEEARTSATNVLSFPSSHTAGSFALATAYSRLYTMRHSGHWSSVFVWAGSHTAASLVGLGRVFAGEHFWTDVGVAWAMGAAFGLLVPWLHEKRSPSLRVQVMPFGQGGVMAAAIY